MMATQGVSLPAVSVLRSVKCPPLVHPSALAVAVAHCRTFGGDEEVLNAAVLAATVLQVHLLQARAAAGVSQPPMPLPPGALPQGAPVAGLATSVPAAGLPSSEAQPELLADPELSEQAKQAMAAARATNSTKPEKEHKLDQEQFEPEVTPQQPQPVVQPMQMTLGTAGVPFMQSVVLPPSLLMPAIRQPVVAPPPVQAVPPPIPVATRPPPRPPTVRFEPPPALATVAREQALRPEGQAPPERPHRDRREDSREDASRVSAPEPKAARRERDRDEEAVRCHLHRKPQPSCKICQRIQSTLRKDDRGKDRLSAGGSRADNDDGTGGRRRIEAFEVTNKQTFNFNAMLRDQILKNTYFKTLMNIETFEGVVDELYQYAETAEVYGAGTTTVPSTLFCCLFRLFTIGISYDELQQLLESRDWPYVRCCGFLYIRFGCASEKLWDMLGDYTHDDQEFEPSKLQPNFVITIGEYVESLLMDERYYYTALPRIPVGVKKKIEEQLAPLPQYRKRTAANKKVLHLFREVGAEVEVCVNTGEWVPGTVVQLVESIPTRIMVRCRLENGRENTQPLGRVILRDRSRPRGHSRSRSRSPRRRENSPDWTRHRGKSQTEMLQELRARQRERAVCNSGKDYARKPIGFMSGLALKRDIGVASSRLREEETYAPRQVEHRKQMTEEEEMERQKELRNREFHDQEKRQFMQHLYEKYGNVQPTAKPVAQPTSLTGEEEPEVLRLGLG